MNVIAQEFIDGGKAGSLVQSGEGQHDFRVSGQDRSRTWSAALRSAFLPAGYPQSVTPDYLGFQFWDTVQALSSYIRGMLSSQAILVGVGVGKEAATATSAVFQFFVRDLAGMLGGILFATYQGSGLDSYAKQWRLFADCLNDLGMAIELASPLWPQAFLLLACMGSVARAITGVAGGATRAALTQHFARARNAADIAAKEGSQETATTMIGMVLGMGLTHLTAGSQAAAWPAFLMLTWLHIAANVAALHRLQMTSLNSHRLDLLLASFWTRGEVAPPAAMAGRETLLAPPLLRLARLLHLAPAEGDISIAPRLSSLRPQLQQQLGQILNSPQVLACSQRYLVVAWCPEGGRAGHERGQALVLLRPGATTQDVLRGYCVAKLDDLLEWSATRSPAAVAAAPGAEARGGGSGGGRPGSSSSSSRQGPGPGWGAVLPSAEDLERLEQFMAGLTAAGWACDRVALIQGDSRVAWGADAKSE